MKGYISASRRHLECVVSKQRGLEEEERFRKIAQSQYLDFECSLFGRRRQEEIARE